MNNLPISSIPENQDVSTISRFATMNIHPDIQKAISSLGFSIPTHIQESAIPAGLAGRDLLACAVTGSGKTAAFAIPLINKLIELKKNDRKSVTRALILAPTRELAAQIRDHIASLARYTRIRAAAIFGGVGMGNQKDAFLTGVDIIVATPGRLLDHFSYAYGKIPALQYLVIDEADRMLDMGFLPAIRNVLRQLPTTPRQTLFFSATLPELVIDLAGEMLKNPVKIDIDRPAVTADGITQTVYPVSDDLKSRLLIHILKSENVRNAIIFTRTKHRANRLSDMLSRSDVQCETIHGNRSQAQRTSALKNFRNGSSSILVATDIASRGIDVEGISHVINFDVPHLPDDYIHRVGRTARAKLSGNAISFVSPNEENDLRQIERHLNQKLLRVKVDGFDYKDRPSEKLEIPLAKRLADHRAKRAEVRNRTSGRPSSKPAPKSFQVYRSANEPRPPKASARFSDRKYASA
ncbi:MAG: DEAD/DEAH box helicase [Candidatus Riflebacteria bacterium]|nr:DEAD/DEAH box helicase [Candidatus Riflebacteria bacterium]